MPHRRKSKKVVVNQPAITPFVHTNTCELVVPEGDTSTPNRTDDTCPKDRTPPSAEKSEAKRLNMSAKDIDSNDVDRDMETETASDVEGCSKVEPILLKRAYLEDESSSDEEEELDNPELKKLERRLSKQMKRCMRSFFKPLRTDVKELLVHKQEAEQQHHIIESLRQDNTTLTKRCETIEKENQSLRQRLNKIENSQLANNLLIHGVPERVWENDSTLRESVYEVMSDVLEDEKYEVRISKARRAHLVKVERVGPPNSKRCRPLSVEFFRHQDMMHLLENRFYTREGVFVEKEFGTETMQARQLMRPILKLAKEIPEYKGKCKMEHDNLVVKGNYFNKDQLHLLPVELSPFRASSLKHNDVLGFFGELNEFSNFYPCDIEYKDIQFHSAEQIIQYEKALYHNDTRVAQLILEAPTAIDCKRIAKNISNVSENEWANAAKDICTPGLRAKFTQNPELLDRLMSTRGYQLVESSFDRLWGTGMPLKHHDALNPNAWHNKKPGILGEILMDIRGC